MGTSIKSRSPETPRRARRSSSVRHSPLSDVALACLENCRIGMAFSGSDMRICYCNSAFAALCDLGVKDVLDRSLSDVLPFSTELCRSQESLVSSAQQPATEMACSGVLTRDAARGEDRHLSLTLQYAESGFIATLTPEKPASAPAPIAAEPPAQPPVIVERRSALPDGRDHFLAILEHELRNPLMPILAWTEVLKQEPSPSSQLRRAISAIERSVLQQRALVDDLLDLASIHNGKLSCEQLPLQIHGLLAESVALFELRAREKGLTLAFESEATHAMVLGDRRRLLQIFENLLDNAIKFTPPGGRIDVRLCCAGNWIRIDVQDTGVGIAEDFMSDLFKTFAQAHPISSRYRRGLGLGLALVKDLVKRHGGRVEAFSPGENRGATFSIQLPLHAGADTSTPAVPLPGPSRKILIVEDRDDTREAIRMLLESWGLQVAEAADGAAGLKLIDEFAPDLVLCDLSMPGMDGWTMARQLREKIPSSKLPLVALSGHGTPGDIQHSTDSGFQAYVVKPCESRNLLAVLTQFLPALKLAPE